MSVQEFRHAEVVASNRQNPVDPTDPDEVRRHIDRWENSQSKTLSLSEYLGWTSSQLTSWLRANESSDSAEELYWNGGSSSMRWAPPPNTVEPFEKLVDDLTMEIAASPTTGERRVVLSEMRIRLKAALESARVLSSEALVR